MNRPTSILMMVLGFGWAQSLLIAGLSLMFATTVSLHRLVPAVGLIGAGLFVAMWLVIDRLVDGVKPSFVSGLKFAAVLLFYTATAVTVYGIFTGRATMLFLPL